MNSTASTAVSTGGVKKTYEKGERGEQQHREYRGDKHGGGD